MALFIMVISSRSRILFKSGISPLQRSYQMTYYHLYKEKEETAKSDLKSADVNMNVAFVFMALLYSLHFVLPNTCCSSH